AQETAEEKYRSIEESETVTIQDAKGVVTEATGFGKLFSVPHLNAYHGASEIQIPFERVETIVTSPPKDNRMPVEVVLRSGRRMKVLLDRPEYETMYGGAADFGYFRIRLQDIRSLTFRRAKKGGEGQGQRCPKGHIYYNDAWHYCPYDGEKLTTIRPEK
ncbi:MAG: hypothetical protein ACYTDY_14400, partial [Planctomycetota bacterium]